MNLTQRVQLSEFIDKSTNNKALWQFWKSVDIESETSKQHIINERGQGLISAGIVKTRKHNLLLDLNIDSKTSKISSPGGCRDSSARDLTGDQTTHRATKKSITVENTPETNKAKYVSPKPKATFRKTDINEDTESNSPPPHATNHTAEKMTMSTRFSKLQELSKLDSKNGNVNKQNTKPYLRDDYNIYVVYPEANSPKLKPRQVKLSASTSLEDNEDEKDEDTDVESNGFQDVDLSIDPSMLSILFDDDWVHCIPNVITTQINTI